ncbi:hypothetical protein ILUMI_15096 [Ignelater luminosus]|uniref:Uncharacterized protein n=1 Tax=Ignelater luminosus TaxID=2038154 RepID=A0A8K0CTL7_IGNLU|nr:hypothetical protein ILUMI_15096 [Ignelater luminosus]
MASQINPPSQRQMGKMIGVSGRMVNYHINKTLKLKVRKKLQIHRLTKVNTEKRKKRSWGLYRALNNVNGARRIQYVSRDLKHPTLKVYQRRENHSSGFMVWGGSPDTAPMDYFVWGYMKQQLWRTKAALKRVWKDMPQKLINKALFKNLQK